MVWHRSTASIQEYCYSSHLLVLGSAVGSLVARFSRIPLGLRLGIFAVVAGVLGVAVSQLTIVGVSGDLVPVLGWKHASRDIEGEDPEPDVDIELGPSVMATDASWAVESMSFEQFLGPERNTQIPITAMGMGFLDTPPEVFWKIPMGKGWSGFVVQGGRALTQEQQGKEETLSCYALATGSFLASSIPLCL